MLFIIYCTTNLINNKIYVGCHETNDLKDGYVGSGRLLSLAVLKYGAENFKTEVLELCATREEMHRREREIVNEDFIKRSDTYNITLGGWTAWHINKDKKNLYGRNRENYYEMCLKGRIAFIELLKDPEYRSNWLDNVTRGTRLYAANNSNPFLGKTHSKETKQIISEKAKIHQLGVGNSQFGTFWITNKITNQKWSNDKGPLPEGFLPGRKMRP